MIDANRRTIKPVKEDSNPRRRAAALFNHALQRTAGSRPGWQSARLARLSLGHYLEAKHGT